MADNRLLAWSAAVVRRLILVKHSLPVLEPAVPAREWRLGEEGRRRCAGLA